MAHAASGRPARSARISASSAAGSGAASQRASSVTAMRQAALVLGAGDLVRAELGQVLGQELAVEQGEAAEPEARHEMDEGELGGVAGAAEHALAEEGAAEDHAIQAADQGLALPDLDRMGMALTVQGEEEDTRSPG